MTESSQQPPPAAIVRKGYQPGGESVRALTLFVVVLVLTGVVVHAGLWFLLKHYLSIRREVDVPTSSVPAINRFPEPNLQPTQHLHDSQPWDDLANLQRQQARVFQQLGWEADRASGLRRVPQSIVDELARRYSAGQGTSPATMPSPPTVASPAAPPAIDPGPLEPTAPRAIPATLPGTAPPGEPAAAAATRPSESQTRPAGAGGGGQ